MWPKIYAAQQQHGVRRNMPPECPALLSQPQWPTSFGHHGCTSLPIVSSAWANSNALDPVWGYLAGPAPHLVPDKPVWVPMTRLWVGSGSRVTRGSG